MQRRVQTVTGHSATDDEIDKMIDTGESETIFQKAIMEQGRGHVSLLASYVVPALQLSVLNKSP